MSKRYYALGAIIVSVIALSGCTINLGLGGGSKGPDGGIYKTVNKGESWQQRSLIPTTSGNPGVINSFDAGVLVSDPSDPAALYYGTLENGMFYTYDGADSWFPVSKLGRVTINAIAVDPQNKCTIYAAIANKVMKSEDCSRTWDQVYYDNQLDVNIEDVVVDHYDSRNVYLATSRGEAIASSDFGRSWRTLNRFDNKVEKIVIAPADSRLIFVATEKKGLFRSKDKGQTWESLAENLKDFPDANRFRDLYVSKVQPGLIILANNYGLIKSINYGDDWTNIKLITPEKEATINSVAISEKDAKEIFYITNTTFYSTADGGDNWSTKKLPSTRAGWDLAVDPRDSNVIYLVVHQIKQ